MKKAIIVGIILFCIGIGIGYYYINISKEKTIQNNQIKEENDLIYNTTTKNTVRTVRTNTGNEKVSPNATLILKKKYKKCEHTIKDYAKIPEELVNLSREEVAKKYDGWEMLGFSTKEIVLYKEYSGICNEHYVIREEKGNITIYKLDENNNETLYKNTDIAIEYLTEEDKNKLKDGIYAYSKEKLNSALEDFE